MPNREKVIKGLEFTKAMITFNPSTGKDIEPGNLNEADKTTYDACVGAIALLKEQEVKPVEVCGQMFTIEYGHCPTCGKGMDSDTYPRWCGFCGQAVKWE